MLDVDHLKSLNDNYGHLAGADAVRTVGYLIAQYSPARAVACRYGGDEFVVAIPDCEVKDAVELAERLRQSVSEVEPVLATHAFPSGTLSISIGTASRLIGKTPIFRRSVKHCSVLQTRHCIELKKMVVTE